MSLIARKCLAGSIRFTAGAQVRHGTFIPVILMQDMAERGTVGEIIEVKRGFARNFLIPRKMAVYATFDNKNKLEAVGVKGFAPTIDNSNLREIIDNISEDKLVLTLGSWATGSHVKSITPTHVRRLLEAEGVSLGKTAIIQIDEIITKPGNYQVKVDGITLPIKVLAAPVA